MKRLKLHLVSLLILLIFTGLSSYAQTCCPVKSPLGWRDQFMFNMSGDNITSQTFRDNDEDWATITNYAGSQFRNDHDYFLRITATSTRSDVNSDDRLVLCWWLGTSTYGKTQNYAGFTGPVAGTYYLQEPFIYEFGPYYSYYSYYWGWQYGSSPASPALVQYKRFSGYTNSGWFEWVNPFSSYVHPRNNQYDYVAFNNYRVEVSAGDNGRLFVAIYRADDCEPTMTIGTKTDPDVNKLTTSVNGSGTLGVVPECEYHTTGETITLTPTPANSSICFTGFTGADASYVTDNGNGTYRLTMQAREMEITANFGSCEKDSVITDTICTGTTYDLAYLRSIRPYLPAAQVNTFVETKYTPDDSKEADITATWTGTVTTTNGKTNYTINVLTAKSYSETIAQILCQAELESFWAAHSFSDPVPAIDGRPVQTTAVEQFTTRYGCDSVVTYNLTINPTTYGVATKWICSNELVTNGFTWWGTTYKEVPAVAPTHTYMHRLYNCDSIVTLDIQVCWADTLYDTIRVCSFDNFSYNWTKTNKGAQSKTSADLKPYSDVAYLVDSINEIKYDCLMADPNDYLFCDSIWYLVVMLQDEPIVKEASFSLCQADLPDFAAGETYPYTFADETGNTHIVNITDTATAEKSGNVYVYRDTVRSAGGCDSAYYILNVKTVNRIVMPTEKRYRCEGSNESGDSWYIPGFDEHNDKEEYENMAEPGYYEDILKSANGCDSIVYSLEVIELPTYSEYSVWTFTGVQRFDTRIKIVEPIYINEGDSYRCGDTDYKESGTHEEHTHTVPVNGYSCDSVIVFTLVVLDNVENIYDTICAGEQYTWHKLVSDTPQDSVYETSGTYTFYTKTTVGTDSVAMLHLQVMPAAVDSAYTRTICYGDTYTDSHFTALTQAETYDAYTKYSIFDCDSVHYSLTLNVVMPVEMPVDTAYRCFNEGAYIWRIDDWKEHNERYEQVFEDSLYLDTLRSVGGSDSVYYALRLIVNPAYVLLNGVTPDLNMDTRVRITRYINKGESYYFNGQYLTEEGEYGESGKTIYTDCDSVTLLTLKVLDNIGNVCDTVCEADLPYIWTHDGGQTVVCETEGDYRFDTLTTHLTDSVVYLHLTVQIAEDRPMEYASICSGGSYDWADHPAYQGLQRADIYHDTIRTARGCDSIRYSLSLTLNPVYTDIKDADTICYDELAAYTWQGETFTSLITSNTGEKQETTITKTLTTLYTGCDSTVQFTLTVYPTYNVEDEIDKCSGEFPFTWNGLTISSLADDGAEVTLQSVAGCDSTVTLRLKQLQSKEFTDVQTVCANSFPFRWNGINITSEEQGNGQQVTLTTADGCDSIVTLALSLHRSYDNIMDATTICYDELADFEWEGNSFTDLITENTGQRQVRSLTQNIGTRFTGCDSIVTFTLIVYPTFEQVIDVPICSSELPYTWRGSDANGEFVETFNETTSMTKYLTTVNGCDSIVTLNLTVNQYYNISTVETICDSDLPYTWEGETFTAAGSRTKNLKSSDGCDSIVTFTLNVNRTYKGITDSDTICYSEVANYRWGKYTFDGPVVDRVIRSTVTDTFPTVNGCDSIVTFTLVVNPEYNITDSRTVCADELPYTWEGITFNTDGTRTKTLKTIAGCDSTVTFTLRVQRATTRNSSDEVCDNTLPYVWTTYREQYLESGGKYSDTLRTARGCDSIIYNLTLTVYTDVVQGTAVMTNQTLCPEQDQLQVQFTFSAGHPETYSLVFDERATQQRFETIEGTVVTGTTTINVPMPYDAMQPNSYPRADDYTASLVVTDRCDKQTVYPLSFRVLYPSSIILQKWNDVLAVLGEKANGGLTFSSIQWYHNGSPIESEGEHNSYIYEYPNLAFGTPYWVELTRADDGKTFVTCPFYPQPKQLRPMPERDAIALRPAEQGDMRRIYIDTELSGKYIVYDITGKWLQSGCFGGEGGYLITLEKNYTSGTYLIYFHCDDGTVEIKKWMLN